MTETFETQVQIVCPVCHEKSAIHLNKSKFPNEKKISTISINRGVICQHHFQAFIDSDYNIRGYQKVDVLLSDSHPKPAKNREDYPSEMETIYQDLWEIIDEKNQIFEEQIKIDSRRQLLKLSKFHNYFFP